MKRLFIKNRKGFLPIIHHPSLLLCISVVLGFAIVLKAAGLGVTYVNSSMSVKKAVAQSSIDPNDAKKYFAKSKELAEKIKKKNLFAPPAPKRHPVKQVSGILGSEALINGKWYKVGDKVADAEITAIEPTQVKIKWDGKEKFFAPLAAANAPGPKKKVKKPAVRKVKNGKTAVPKTTVEKAPAESQEEDPLAWMGVTLSAKVRAKILERWNTLTDEQKEQFKEQWNSMSDEQKQQAVDAWEKHL